MMQWLQPVRDHTAQPGTVSSVGHAGLLTVRWRPNIISSHQVRPPSARSPRTCRVVEPAKYSTSPSVQSLRWLRTYPATLSAAVLASAAWPGFISRSPQRLLRRPASSAALHFMSFFHMRKPRRRTKYCPHPTHYEHRRDRQAAKPR
jgi:hypothetical protein